MFALIPQLFSATYLSLCDKRVPKASCDGKEYSLSSDNVRQDLLIVHKAREHRLTRTAKLALDLCLVNLVDLR